jgi:hypothetical protein
MAFHHYLNMQGLEMDGVPPISEFFVPGKSSLKISVECNFLQSRILLSFPQKYHNQRTLHCPETNGVSSLPEYAGTEDGWRSTNIRKDIRTADGWNQSA